MKKMSSLFLVLMMFLLCGCAKGTINDEKNNFDYTVYERPSIAYYEDSESSQKKEAIVLLKDYESYQEYVSVLSSQGMSEDFKEGLSAYNETFFEQEMLIVLAYSASSGMSKLSLQDIVYEEMNIHVELRCDYPKGMQTDDMKDYAVIIRLPLDAKFTTVNYSVVDKHELPPNEFDN